MFTRRGSTIKLQDRSKPRRSSIFEWLGLGKKNPEDQKRGSELEINTFSNK